MVGNCAGVMIAIEMAMILQETGEVSKLILLDMTPERMNAILKENFDEKSDEDIDDYVLIIFSQVLGIDRSEVNVPNVVLIVRN